MCRQCTHVPNFKTNKHHGDDDDDHDDHDVDVWHLPVVMAQCGNAT